MNALKPLKKPKGLKRLKGLGGPPEKLDPLPQLGEGPQRVAGLVDDALSRLTRELEDEQLAKRVLKLQEKFPDGTIPELIVYDWLERHGFRFEFQFWVLGGRILKGGQVLDFVVDTGIYATIIEVQGKYWHTRPGKVAADEGERLALLSIEIWGKPTQVVEVWDTRLLDKDERNRVMWLAIGGIEMGV